uniref:Uncharacterized protein n=1 Tax=Phytophthora fragariae TaxID=53985 RepID=A0A6A3DGL9_9STRA|nr:hypothetical protein PF009_g29158 [Phytophthora fragariae]
MRHVLASLTTLSLLDGPSWGACYLRTPYPRYYVRCSFPAFAGFALRFCCR